MTPEWGHSAKGSPPGLPLKYNPTNLLTFASDAINVVDIAHCFIHIERRRDSDASSQGYNVLQTNGSTHTFTVESAIHTRRDTSSASRDT